MLKKYTFASFSFGCRVNEAEREAIDRDMVKAGFVFDNKDPDLYIINTCAITQKAEREARQFVFRLKKDFPDTQIILTGCSATYWKKHHKFSDLPASDWIENSRKSNLVQILKNRYLSGPSDRPENNLAGWGGRNKFLGSGRAMLKIQDGCQRFCTYCIVPYLRGQPKSDRIENLVRTAKILENTTKELVVTAINTEAFGHDTGESLVDLLEALLDKTTIPRISLGSLHPWSMNDKFFNFYEKVKNKNRLVNFFHVPVQSGSDKILTLMRRGYTVAEMTVKLNKLHEINPDALLATDVIVGFLGEDENDFEETYRFLKDSPISKFHVFRYSGRKNTAAYYLSKSLSEPSSDIKKLRAQKLIKLSEQKFSEFQKKFLHRIVNVLILEKNSGEYREGLTDNQLTIFIEDKNKALIPAEIRKVEVISYKNGCLFGKII